MANDDVRRRINELRIAEESATEREILMQQLKVLKQKKWERDHPRRARLKNFFNNSGGQSREDIL